MVVAAADEPTSVVVKVANVKDTLLLGSHQQARRRPLEALLARVLNDVTSVVVLVGAFAELDEPVEGIVLCRNAVAAVGQLGQVTVGVVGEAPRFGCLNSHQLTVGVVRVVFHVNVRLEANVARVGARLIDATLGVVAELHTEDFNVVQRQRRLGQIQVRRQHAREDGRAVEQRSLVGPQPRHLELPELFDGSRLGLVSEELFGQHLTTDAALEARQAQQSVVGVGELVAGQRRLGAVVGALVDDQTTAGHRQLGVGFEVALQYTDSNTGTAIHRLVLNASVSAHFFGQRRSVVAVNDTARLAGEHDKQPSTVRVVVLDVGVTGAAAAWRQVHQLVEAHRRLHRVAVTARSRRQADRLEPTRVIVHVTEGPPARQRDSRRLRHQSTVVSIELSFICSFFYVEKGSFCNYISNVFACPSLRWGHLYSE